MKKLLARYDHLSQLKKNVVSGSIFFCVNTLITIVSYPLYLHYINVKTYGAWSSISVILLFGQLGELGIGAAITKFVAAEHGKKDVRSITGYITASFIILLAPSIVITLLVLVLNVPFLKFIKVDPSLIANGWLLIIAVGLLSVFSLFVSIVRGAIVGVGRMDIANYSFMVSRIIQIVVNVVFLISGYGLWALYFGFFLYYAFPFAIWIFILFKGHRIRVFSISSFDKKKLSELIRFGSIFSTGVLASMFVMPFNRIIIARFIGLEYVTYYEIAIRVVMSIRDLFMKGLEAILPKISSIHGSVKESIGPILAVHKKGMKLVLYVALPAFLFMFLFCDPILKIWLGSRFNENITVILRFLIVGWAVNALVVPDYFMFIGINKLKYSIGEEWIKSSVNIFLVLLLILIKFKMTLSTIGFINAASLICGAFFLKCKYFKYRASLVLAAKGTL